MPSRTFIFRENELCSEVAVDVIKQSKIVWQMLQDLGSEDANDEIEALPIPNVNYAILKKIITWCE